MVKIKPARVVLSTATFSHASKLYTQCALPELKCEFFGNTIEETYHKQVAKFSPQQLKTFEKTVLALGIHTLYHAGIVCKDD
eukprot:10815311-Ditylum_brightwellii.AAC.1